MLMTAAMLLSNKEKEVLELLPRGCEQPIKISRLATIAHIDVRTVYEIINRLVTKYGVPVVGNRNGNINQRGVFIATTEEERDGGLIPLISQVNEVEQRIDAVKRADLINWYQSLNWQDSLL